MSYKDLQRQCEAKLKQLRYVFISAPIIEVQDPKTKVVSLVAKKPGTTLRLHADRRQPRDVHGRGKRRRAYTEFQKRMQP